MTDPVQPTHYIVAHVREALASDPRANELNVQVTVAGNRVFLMGEVTTSARRDAITTVTQELLPGYDIVNETSVASFTEPPAVENL